MPTTRIKTFFRTYFSTLTTFLILFLPAPEMTVKAAGEIDPTFNAGAFRQPRGSATTIVMQPDGKVLIGGNFEVASGALKYSLVRVNPDGSADTTFNPPRFADNTVNRNLPGIVEAIALQPDGRIIVAGNFIIRGINLKAPIVRLNADGSVDLSFNFAARDNLALSGVINDVEIRADGKIFIAGSFGYASTPGVRINLARLNADGSVDETFNPPGVSLPIDDIAVQPDGKVIGFAAPGNGGTRFLRRLNADGSLDTTFNTLVGSEVYSMKIQPDGKIVLCGSFWVVNGVSRYTVARLNTDGSLDATFTSPFHSNNFPGLLYDVEIDGDGKILVGGGRLVGGRFTNAVLWRLNADGTFGSSQYFFNALTPDNGFYLQILDLALLANGQVMIAGSMTQREFSVGPPGPVGAAANRLNASGAYDSTFQTPIGFRGNVRVVAPLPNGQIVIGGLFSAVNRTPSAILALLNADGTLDTTFNPPFSIEFRTIVLAATPFADNRIMVGGLSHSASLERLNIPSGSRDPTFNIISPLGFVYDIAVQPDGKVISASKITPSGDSTRCVTKLNPNGSQDSSFQFPGLSGEVVRKILVQPDGKILMGGLFSGIGDISRNNIARLNADGTLDTSFNPPGGANATVTDMALERDGKVLISGEFSQVNGVNRQGIARLNADGSLDATFDAAANSPVYAVELQADEKILVGGAFTGIGGAPRNRIARLNPNGSIDSTFEVGAGADGDVYSIELDASGRVLAGGEFVRYDNTPRVGIVRLLNDIAPQATPFDYDAKSGQVKNYDVGDEFSLYAPAQRSFRLHQSRIS
jgi:uncharacterized delta-60 repeat protein